jgi:hypothetical protein
VIHLQVRYSTFKLAGVVMTRKCSSSWTSQVASQDNAGTRQIKAGDRIPVRPDISSYR